MRLSAPVNIRKTYVSRRRSADYSRYTPRRRSSRMRSRLAARCAFATRTTSRASRARRVYLTLTLTSPLILYMQYTDLLASFRLRTVADLLIPIFQALYHAVIASVSRDGAHVDVRYFYCRVETTPCHVDTTCACHVDTSLQAAPAITTVEPTWYVFAPQVPRFTRDDDG